MAVFVPVRSMQYMQILSFLVVSIEYLAIETPFGIRNILWPSITLFEHNNFLKSPCMIEFFLVDTAISTGDNFFMGHPVASMLEETRWHTSAETVRSAVLSQVSTNGVQS